MAKVEVALKKRKTKLKKNLQLAAIKAAKDANDPLYKKFVKFRKLWKLYQKKILLKYAPKVKSKVLKKL